MIPKGDELIKIKILNDTNMKRRKIKETKGLYIKRELIIGETIEKKVAKMIDNQEPIKDAVPLIYQDKKEGVLPEYDIRTDRFMIAINAMDKISSYKMTEYLKDDGIQPIQEEEEGKTGEGSEE